MQKLWFKKKKKTLQNLKFEKWTKKGQHSLNNSPDKITTIFLETTPKISGSFQILADGAQRNISYFKWHSLSHKFKSCWHLTTCKINIKIASGCSCGTECIAHDIHTIYIAARGDSVWHGTCPDPILSLFLPPASCQLSTDLYNKNFQQGTSHFERATKFSNFRTKVDQTANH